MEILIKCKVTCTEVVLRHLSFHILLMMMKPSIICKQENEIIKSTMSTYLTDSNTLSFMSLFIYLLLFFK